MCWHIYEKVQIRGSNYNIVRYHPLSGTTSITDRANRCPRSVTFGIGTISIEHACIVVNVDLDHQAEADHFLVRVRLGKPGSIVDHQMSGHGLARDFCWHCHATAYTNEHSMLRGELSYAGVAVFEDCNHHFGELDSQSFSDYSTPREWRKILLAAQNRHFHHVRSTRTALSFVYACLLKAKAWLDIIA